MFNNVTLDCLRNKCPLNKLIEIKRRSIVIKCLQQKVFDAMFRGLFGRRSSHYINCLYLLFNWLPVFARTDFSIVRLTMPITQCHQ
jgi:hypothetical protein